MEITISPQPSLIDKRGSKMHSRLFIRGSRREIVLLAFLVIFAFFIGAQPAKAGTIIKSPAYLGLQNGLVGCWTFDGAYDKAPDCSGNNNTGTLTNGPLRTQGQLGQALSFDGSNDYVNIGAPSSLELGTSDMTSVAWIKTNGVTNDGLWRDILTKYESSPADIDFALQLAHASEGTPTVGTRIEGGLWANFNNLYIADNLALDDNKWHFVTVTRRNGTASLYVDGNLRQSGSITQNSITGVTPWTIGQLNTSDGQNFAGSIDDVRVFNRALSATEVARMYKIGLASKQNEAQGNDQLDKGLVGHWTMDANDIGLSGTTAKDRSGQKNHGTLTNGPLATVGKMGQALDFDGVNDHVLVPSNASFRPANQLTMAAWVKPSSFSAASLIFSSGDSAISRGYNLFVRTTKQPCVYLGTSGDTSGTASSPAMVAGKWSHIAATYNGTTLVVYLDGVSYPLIAAGGCNVNTGTGDITYGSSAVLSIGAKNTGISPFFPGSIDDARVYNRALSAGEISRLYQMGQPRVNATKNSLDYGLVGHWTFDGADIGLSGTTAKDRSGQNNHGTLTGGPLQAIGRIGQALSFDGSNDYVDLGTGLDQNGEVTMSAWIKADDISTNRQSVITNSSSAGTAADYSLDINRTTGRVSVLRSSTAVSVTGNQTLQAGKWYHIVGVISGSSGNWTVSVYVDGVLDKSATDTNNANGTNQTTAIGRQGAFNGRYFNGPIDDVRLYNRALSAGEINKLWQMGR